jgi:hypothetical protein
MNLHFSIKHTHKKKTYKLFNMTLIDFLSKILDGKIIGL